MLQRQNQELRTQINYKLKVRQTKQLQAAVKSTTQDKYNGKDKREKLNRLKLKLNIIQHKQKLGVQKYKMLGPKPRTVVPRTQNRYKMKLEETTNKNIRAEVIHIYMKFSL